MSGGPRFFIVKWPFEAIGIQLLPSFISKLCQSHDTNTFGSPIILGSLIGLSTSLSIIKFGLTIVNVGDGVCCILTRSQAPW